MQNNQFVAVVRGGELPPAEEFSESCRSDYQRIVERLEMGRHQPVGFLVVDHQVR